MNEIRFTLNGIEIAFQLQSDAKTFKIASIDTEPTLEFELCNNNGLLEFITNPGFEEDQETIHERLLLLSEQNIENLSSSFEAEIQTRKAHPAYAPDQIYVENKPFSLKQIIELIESKDIELNPDFQRNFVWDKTRQSRLIESILLGLPLPSIYLSQFEDGRLTIVDGLQRIHTIKKFYENKLRLTNLEYLVKCNGMYLKDLETVLEPVRLRAFRQTMIMCFVIDRRSPSQLKFDLFRRLNTGGKPLNNAEIRNCLSLPPVQKFLNDCINEPIVEETIGINSKKDTRMEFKDSILRFIYFYQIYDELNSRSVIEKYSGDIEQTLDEFVDEMNRKDQVELDRFREIFITAMKWSYQLFGDLSFRKISPDFFSEPNQKRTQINKALMLSTMVIISHHFDELTLSGFIDSRSRMEKLSRFMFNDEELFLAITNGTNGKSNLESAFKKIKQFFNHNKII